VHDYGDQSANAPASAQAGSAVGTHLASEVPESIDHAATYAAACTRTDSAQGFYNRNIRVADHKMVLNVRIPLADSDQMDQRQWPEPSILTAIAPYISAAPRLYYHCTQPAYQIQEYIEGTPLHQLAPRGHEVPDHVPADVARLFAQLRQIPSHALPHVTGGLDDDPHRFARRLWDTTRQIYLARRDEYGPLFNRLRIPRDPFAPLDGIWKTLRSRPFRLIHCDLSRRNMIIRDRSTVFLDWELALYGDPLADVATHLHKMGYTPDEQQRFLAEWQTAEPAAATEDWEHDLQTYLAHERIKSAVIDSIRFATVIAEGNRSPEEQQYMLKALTRKLSLAAALWGLSEPVDIAEVDAALRPQPGPGSPAV
jgi:aminoglycoside phosphotransferase (APT) family kinase protein